MTTWIITPRGGGKTQQLIKLALDTAESDPSTPVYIIASTTKKVSLFKKRMMDTNGSIPKNIIFEGADAFFSKGPSRVKNKLTVRLFFDDADDILKALSERTLNGKVSIEAVTATEEERDEGHA